MGNDNPQIPRCVYVPTGNILNDNRRIEKNNKVKIIITNVTGYCLKSL